jgi:hypothetical protein
VPSFLDMQRNQEWFRMGRVRPPHPPGGLTVAAAG